MNIVIISFTGESGTGKSGQKYNYYACTGRKREHICDKKAVPQDIIENKVINHVLRILHDDKMLEFIADAVWKYYQSQHADDETKKALQLKLSEIETATRNIMKAIEAGIFNDATKKRMDELDIQKSEIESELAGIELQQTIKISRDYVLFFLTELRKGDTKSPEFQQRLIDTFVNAVFVYDDKITIAFNYSTDGEIVTFEDVESFENGGCGCSFAMRDIAPNRNRLRLFRFFYTKEIGVSCLI